MKRIVIVNAGLSQESATARLGRAIEAELQTVGQTDVSWVDLRTLARPIADHLVTGFPNVALGEALQQVTTADAVVALTPTYQGSYSGLFKSFFDLIDAAALTDVPVLLGATGGTPRHSLVTEHALRPLFSYLHAIVVPTALFVATEDWGAHAVDSDGTAGRTLPTRISRAVSQLMGLLNGSTSQPRQAADEFVEVVDFAELLRGASA
ncbi:MAG: oxidoreductase [Actinobacteria bacterium HGW-Actinobacteria-2]|nr:MAG: oxidoreductase [Actinobacteria bacterium HGW-Actinobacteria-2]